MNVKCYQQDESFVILSLRYLDVEIVHEMCENYLQNRNTPHI